MRVRHSTFRNCTGVAIRESLTYDWLTNSNRPATVVDWDKPNILNSIVANCNLVFIVPAVTREA